MVRFQPGQCPYCGHGFVYAPAAKRRRGDLPPNADTIDHVYPVTFPVPSGLPRDALLNKQRCCNACNQRKGNLHPLKWLTMIENPARRAAFADLLRKLGESPKLIMHAMEWQSANQRISQPD